jgi:hypothetical protein
MRGLAMFWHMSELATDPGTTALKAGVHEKGVLDRWPASDRA